MKAFQIEGDFGLENLQLAELPEPEPGPGEVLVGVKAVSLNYRDFLMAKGLYDPKQPLPLVPCSDGAGVVEAVGPGVDRVAVGDRVATLFSQRWLGGPPRHEKVRATLGGPLSGTLAERRVLSQDGVVKTPEHLEWGAAATLPCAAVTAWSALVTWGSVGPGDVVLLQGTGGVSIFALQFAQILGARAIITSSREEKLERARELGAWETINYAAEPKWGKKALELTGGRGVDHVVEVGGAETLAQSLRALRIGGEISLIGVLSGTAAELDIIPILMKSVRVQGIFVGSRDDFEAMNRAIGQHRLEPVVDRVFPFEETREAFAYLAGARHFGKVVIEVA